MRGQRDDFCAKIALSRDTRSLGRSFIYQSRIWIWLPRVFTREYFGEMSRARWRHSFCHSLIMSARYLPVKGPT